jgi:hypothetical protein
MFTLSSSHLHIMEYFSNFSQQEVFSFFHDLKKKYLTLDIKYYMCKAILCDVESCHRTISFSARKIAFNFYITVRHQ